MAAPNLLTNLFHICCDKITKKERLLVEIFFSANLYQELIQLYQKNFNNFEYCNREEFVGNEFVIRLLVNDLLASKEYSLEGLACYTGYPEDVIFDLAAGTNVNPTLGLATKIIELHAVTRKELYHDLIKKIISQVGAYP